MIDSPREAPVHPGARSLSSSSMIHRNCRLGEKLDVAGLNEITVLIDRSQTELTEVAMNSWSPGLDGPPHAHDRKEQNFFVTAGRGLVRIGAESFPAEPGDYFHVPAGVVHQTVNRQPEQRLDYFLFNAFLDAGKEGHASFADHIDQVREIRRRQAERQSAAADPALGSGGGRRPGKRVATGGSTAARLVLVDRREAERCEAILFQVPAGGEMPSLADPAKEQTLLVLEGSARVTLSGQPVAIAAGEVLFVPRAQAIAGTAGAGGLRLVSFGTVVTR